MGLTLINGGKASPDYAAPSANDNDNSIRWSDLSKAASEAGPLSSDDGGLIKRVTIFPKEWGTDLICSEGQKAYWSRHIREKAIQKDLDSDPDLEDVSEGLIYELRVENYGLHDMPGVEKERAYRFIGHKDLKDAPTVVLHIPGIGFTHRYLDTKWFVHLIAQIAKLKQYNFLVYNPLGRGVEGYDGANVSSIPLKAMKEDTYHAVLKVLRDPQKSRPQELNVIVSAHSLGAPLASRVAHDIITQHHNDIKLKGLILEAPFSDGLMRDFFTAKHFQAVWPYLAEAFKNSLLTDAPGKDFTLQELQRLFLGPTYGTPENCIVLADSLQRGEYRLFFDATLSSYRREFSRTVHAAYAADPSFKAKIVQPTEDTIFAERGIRKMVKLIEEARTKVDNAARDCENDKNPVIKIDRAPHCFVVPIADEALVREVKTYLEKAYGLEQNSLTMPPAKLYQ